MQVLISVSSATEARAALDGGADIIDAKDPTRGSLGAVDAHVLAEIARTVGHKRQMSAALGDASDVEDIGAAARGAASCGVAYVKVGLARVRDPEVAWGLLRAAIRGASAAAGRCGVIAVAYADCDRAQSPSPHDVVDAAKQAGAAGVLLDSAFKDGVGLFGMMNDAAVGRWIEATRAAGLLTAIAGQLVAADLDRVRRLGADIAGFRSAACEGGRTGTVARERVRALIVAARSRSSPEQRRVHAASQPMHDVSPPARSPSPAQQRPPTA